MSGATEDVLEGELRKVFEAKRPPPTSHPTGFAPLEHSRCDDELVYSASPAPFNLNVTRKLGGRKSLMFESLLCGSFCEALVDSGASHSFVSLHFLQDNGIGYQSVEAPEATLADGSCLAIVGVVTNMHMQIGNFKFKESFLVVDISNLEVVLGMSFLAKHNPRINWRERCMHVVHKGTDLTIPTVSHPPLPMLHSSKFELCSFDALSKRALTSAAAQEAFLGCLIPECFSLNVAADQPPDPLLSGPGAKDRKSVV